LVVFNPPTAFPASVPDLDVMRDEDALVAAMRELDLALALARRVTGMVEHNNSQRQDHATITTE